MQEWTCCEPSCGKRFRRYRNAVRNPDSVYCSKTCYALRLKVANKGEGNANYRGGITLGTACHCGKAKDSRSMRCADCANRGFAAAGEPSVLPSEAEVRAAFASARSLAAVARELGIARKTARLLADRYEISLAHMRPGRGRPFVPESIFVLGVKRNGAVRAALLRLEPENYFCKECGQGPEWQGRPLTLDLDHMNGNPADNRRENLRWLCPNCHSQTSTWKGRNRGRQALPAPACADNGATEVDALYAIA